MRILPTIENKENSLIRKIAQLFSLFAAWGKTALCSDRTFLLTSREGTMRKKYGTLIFAKEGLSESSILFRKTLRLLAFMTDLKVDAERQSFKLLFFTSIPWLFL